MAVAICSTKLKLDDTNTILKKRGLDKSGKVQEKIDSEVIRLMSPYTPKDTGELIASATTLTQIGFGQVKQGGGKAPYARSCYYNSKKFTGSPVRGNRWFARMCSNGGKKSILQTVKQMTGGK